MGSFVHLICDYAANDLAWAEIMAAVGARIPHDTRTHMTTVGSFETVATGFLVAQLGLADKDLRPDNLIIFANCAPRKDRRDARVDNEGEGLLFGVLKTGVQVVAVNSGYSMSFIRNDLDELWNVDVKNEGSQFRSRDFYPRIVGCCANRDYSFKRHRLDPIEVIPEPPSRVIGYIDSFGNLKTTIRSGDPITTAFAPGERIKVVIGHMVRTATVATGSFNVMEGDLAFAPGSSGHDRRFWEFFQRGGSAAAEFNHPAVGTKIQIDLQGALK